MKQEHQKALKEAIVELVEALLYEKWDELHEDFVAQHIAHDSDRPFKFNVSLPVQIEQQGDSIRVKNSIGWNVKKHADAQRTIAGTPDMFEPEGVE